MTDDAIAPEEELNMTDDGSQLRQRLLDAVPALPEPVDRLKAVGARVRRRRLRWAAVLTAATAVVAVLAVPFLIPRTGPAPTQVVLPAPPPLAADGCPVTWITPPPVVFGKLDRTSPLVPADGALSVSMCEVAIPQFNPAGSRMPVLTLTTGVDQFIAALNALPPMFVPEVTVTTATPDAQPFIQGGLLCSMVAFGQRTFVIRYAGHPTPIAVVTTDRNCLTVQFDGATRRLGFDERLFDIFLDLYRAQPGASLSPS